MFFKKTRGSVSFCILRRFLFFFFFRTFGLFGLKTLTLPHAKSFAQGAANACLAYTQIDALC